MAKSKKLETRTYYVCLPEGVNVEGYSAINLSARTQAVSLRDAVSNVIARRMNQLGNKVDFPEGFVGRVMRQLDEDYGGAENYAFENPELRPPFIEQTPEERKVGGELTTDEKRILREHAFAYQLAESDGRDTSNPTVRMHYLGRARYLLKEFGKIR